MFVESSSDHFSLSTSNKHDKRDIEINGGIDTAVITLFTNIQDQIGQIKLDLKSHIENTKKQFDIMHDELYSMKKYVTVNRNITQNKMEILTEI